jgi:CspA family cold shock protein
MPNGRIKWFSPVKGYGFIAPDGGGADVFVHFTSLVVREKETLSKGDRVAFDVVEGEKGPKALNVRPALCEAPDGGDDEHAA